MSANHVCRYLAQFDFRYNARKGSNAKRTAEALKGARGKRVYRQPSSMQPNYLVPPRVFGEPRKRWTR